MKLSTSILSLKNFNDIKKLSEEKIDYLHLDIMDGIYVENKTKDLKEIKNYVTKPFDIHLMVDDVLKYIRNYQELNPEYITFHLKTKDKISEVISYLKNNNIKIGIALNPEEKVEEILPYLNEIDLVLIMSVHPGKGGQKFIPEVLEKVDYLSKIEDRKFLISIDGGINDSNIKLCNKCDIVVVGSFITNGNFQKQIKKLEI